MRILPALAAWTLLVAGSAVAQPYEFKMIASGPNRPGVPLWDAPYRNVLVALHAGTPMAELAAACSLSNVDLAAALERLRGEGAVTEVDGALRPACMVISIEEGATLDSIAAEVADAAMSWMGPAVDTLHAHYRDVRGLRHLDFEDVSFFLASDVLLDNWQIRSVERRWLGAERPLRGASHYYCALVQRGSEDFEALGIYGNQVIGLGDGRRVGVYGNRRGGVHDLTRLPAEHLARWSGLPDTTARDVQLGRVVDALRSWIEAPADAPPPQPLASGMTGMGLTHGGRPLFAILDPGDRQALAEMAGRVTDDLIGHLERATPALRNAWSSSRWGAEVTFEEYRIWWYHVFYTALTDRLAEAGVIRIPSTGLFHYAIVP